MELANMFLIDRRKKMVRKIAIIIPVFFLCLGLNSCKSPFEPEPINVYRSNVEVIYTSIEANDPHVQDGVTLFYYLYNPATWDSTDGFYNMGSIKMDKIGENTYRCYLPTVFIQTTDKWFCHSITIRHSYKTQGGFDDEKVDLQEAYIQGAYEQETEYKIYGIDFMDIHIHFKMSNN